MQLEQKITIYGAGAIGCVVAARLILAGYRQVSLIARGENKIVLEQQGIHLTDLTGEHHVRPAQIVASVGELEAQDYIFICTKFDALQQITASLKNLLHEHSVIVPLMNGIPFWYFYQGQEGTVQTVQALDPQGQLITHFPLQHLVAAVVFITAQLESYGVVVSKNPYLLLFGEPNHQSSERLDQLAHLFDHTEIAVRKETPIRDQIWTKVMANLSSNPLSVVTGATLADIYAHPHLSDIAQKITQEVRQVAASYGARISIDPQTFMQLGAEMGQTHTSMWYDYQKGQALELANIVDAVLELAEKYHCPMPVTQHIGQLTKYLSEKSQRS